MNITMAMWQIPIGYFIHKAMEHIQYDPSAQTEHGKQEVCLDKAQCFWHRLVISETV